MNNRTQAMTAAADITRKKQDHMAEPSLRYFNEKKQPSFQSSSTNLLSVMGMLKIADV